MRTIFHIDVNSAYLSWTSVENLKTGNGPDLREIPAIIGGDQKTRHGVVLAKSIPAKKFGIHTGEPVVNALKKCPNLVMAPPNHDLYHAYSCRMMDFLHSLTPDIEQVSMNVSWILPGFPITIRHLTPLPDTSRTKSTAALALP